jgi:hypothetical protein
VKKPGVPGRVEIRVRAMQKATVVPHQDFSGAPIVVVDKALLRGVVFQRLDPRAPFFYR